MQPPDIDASLIGYDEGEEIDPESLVPLQERSGKLSFPPFNRETEDLFIQSVARSGKKWVILTDPQGLPHYALDSDKFLREALVDSSYFSPWQCCHSPIIVRDLRVSLGDVILLMKTGSTQTDDGAIDRDIVLVWGEKKKIVTGADILGRLLKGVLAPTDLRWIFNTTCSNALCVSFPSLAIASCSHASQSLLNAAKRHGNKECFQFRYDKGRTPQGFRSLS